MKIHRFVLFSLTFLLSTSLALANTGDEKLTKENVNTRSEAEINARVEVLQKRVEEIQSMDFSAMTRAEKKEVREELKEIKKEAGLDNRISISVGALIIILLLLIIIL